MTHASDPTAPPTRFFDQPRAVWAVAFAAVVSFMGLGLVDPILPAIASELHASPSDVSLLFTSYFAVTGVAMLVSSAVASRIGAKKTLLAGLLLIIVFSALAGLAGSVWGIVGLRAGWGLGNALFIATALSVIVGASSGGVPAAVMVYEAALGLGISVGPLLGGELGGISWRGPFFGVAVLMLIGLVATTTLLEATPKPPKSEHLSVLDPVRALRHRTTRATGVIALFYNFGFFTLLAYTPFPLGLGAQQLGLVYTGWGLLLAVFAVFVAPRITSRLGDIAGLGIALSGLVLTLLAMGVLSGSQTALIVGTIASGAFLGLNNTFMTQVVMETARVPRPVASASYSFVRFTGGAIAPFVATKLGAHLGVSVPFYVGAGMTAVAIAAVVFYRGALRRAEGDELEPEEVAPEPPAVAVTDATGATPMLVAVGGPDARRVAAMCVRLARARGGEVHVLHVVESRAVPDGTAHAVDLETAAAGHETLEACIAELRESGVPVRGRLIGAYGSHADVAARILGHAHELGVGLIAIGHDTRGTSLADGVTGAVAARAGCHVVVVNPSAGALGRHDHGASPLPA